LLARDRHGVLRGYLHLVPCYGSETGYSLEAMRREPATPNGLTEFMIVRAASALREKGCTRLSLNFAVFARLLSDDIPLTWLQKIQRAVIRRLNPYFQLQSLLSFNAKFFPSWIPRCIYYEERQHLPRIAISYLQLESFVRLPFGPMVTARPPDRRVGRIVRRFVGTPS
jgi:lysyl-tRNA synthetase, class II